MRGSESMAKGQYDVIRIPDDGEQPQSEDTLRTSAWQRRFSDGRWSPSSEKITPFCVSYKLPWERDYNGG